MGVLESSLTSSVETPERNGHRLEAPEELTVLATPDTDSYRLPIGSLFFDGRTVTLSTEGICHGPQRQPVAQISGWPSCLSCRLDPIR